MLNKQKPSYSIAILGCGLSGLSVVASFVKYLPKLDVYIELHLYDIPERFAQGVAYQIDTPPYFRLNNAATNMASLSVHKNDLGFPDFYNWVQENIISLKKQYSEVDLENPQAAWPRSLYGFYMISRYEEIKKIGQLKGIIFIEHLGKVTSIRSSDDLVLLESYNCIRNTHNSLVLATGHGLKAKRKLLPLVSTSFTPYPAEYLAAPIEDKTVAILGSSLSAVEIALALVGKGAQKVHLVSRHGLLPHVKGKSSPYVCKYFTLKNLEIMTQPGKPFRLSLVLSLLQQDLRLAYHLKGLELKSSDIQELVYPSDPLIALDREIQEVQNDMPQIWRGLLDAHEAIRQEVYNRLDERDREILMKKLHSTFMTFNASMILSTAQMLYKYMNQGKIILHKGFVSTTYDYNASKHIVTCLENTILADMAIEAVGESYELTDQEVYEEAVQNKLVQQSKLGGFLFDLRTNLVKTSHSEQTIYALGPQTDIVRRASTNSLLVRRLGDEIAKSLVDKIVHLTTNL